MVMLSTPITVWLSHLFACMGGCFGCCTKPTPIIAVDEPTKGLRIQGRIVRKPSASDDFWSTSTYDLEYSAFQSQRSLSSISITNQTLNHCSSTSGISSHPDFVNQGLLLWNQTRLQWVTGAKSSKRTQQTGGSSLSSWNTTYESLLASRTPFPRPIPLSEMVDFLVDVWEHEGLYD